MSYDYLLLVTINSLKFVVAIISVTRPYDIKNKHTHNKTVQTNLSNSSKSHVYKEK